MITYIVVYEQKEGREEGEVTVVGLLMAAYRKIDYPTGLELKPDYLCCKNINIHAICIYTIE
jgi:hypothetical protein